MHVRLSARAAGAIAAIAVVCSWGFQASAVHISATWNTNQIGIWSDPLKWSSTPLFPNNVGGNTFDATINSASSLVTLDVPVLINQFNLSAGTLTAINLGTLGGTTTISLNGAFNWTGGTLNGPLTMQVASAMDISGAGHGFAGASVVVGPTATATWSSGTVNSVAAEGGIVSNAGTFDDQTDDGWFWDSTRTPIFNNTGTYIKSAGTAQSGKQLYPAFNNSGYVDVQTSDLWLAGGGHHTGSFTVAADARLLFSDFFEFFASAGAPTTTFASTSSINSSGTVAFDNDFGNALTHFAGTYDSAFTLIDPAVDGLVVFDAGAHVNESVEGDLQVISGTVVYQTGNGPIGFTNGILSAGTIAGSDNLFFDTFEWSGGTILGDTFSDVTTGILQISGSSIKRLIDQRFYNGVGATSQIGGTGTIELWNSTIINLAGGSITVSSDMRFFNIDTELPSLVVNDGTFTKSGGSGVTELLDVLFLNNGTTQVQSGTLRLAGGGTHTGAFSIAASATLELDDSTINSVLNAHEFESGSSIVGAAASTLRIVGQATFKTGSSVNNSGATVVAAGGQVSYNGGSFTAGNLQLTGGGDFILSVGANKTLRTTSITTDTGNGSRLDLANNRAVVDYSSASPIESIRQQIRTAYNSGAWNGNGITSSSANATNFALGYAEASGLTTIPSPFGVVDGTAVLICHTRYGDADLDGDVDLDDVGRWSLNFTGELGGAGTKFWHQGDWDYDGDVDLDDVGKWSLNFTGELGGGLVHDLPHAVAAEAAAILRGIGVTVVPEPAMLALVLMLSGYSLSRRPLIRGPRRG